MYTLFSCPLLHREEAVEFGIYHIRHLLEVLRIIAKLTMVAIDDDELALVFLNPCLIASAEALKIVQTHSLLVLTSTLLNLRYQRGDAGADVDHEVRQLHQRHHQVEEILVVVEVAVTHHALSMQIGGEDTGILEDGTFLF